MNNNQIVETPISAARIAKHKATHRSIKECEGQLLRLRNHLLNLSHGFGRELCEFKEEIGHGRWMLWLISNYRELGPAENTIIINAQRYMALFQRNPTAKDWTEFTKESIRKFMWHYVPVKERMALEGDRKDHPEPHYLTFVNNFAKWDRQIAIGQAELPPIETLRHELENTQRRFIAICGADWVRSLLPATAEIRELQVANG